MNRNFLYLLSVLSLLQLGLAFDIPNAIKSHKHSSGNAVGAVYLTIDKITNGPCSLDVYWTCSNCDVDGFNVTWQEAGKNKESVQSLIGDRSDDYLIENLNSDASYTVWVTAVVDGEETLMDSAQQSTAGGEPVEVTGVTIGEVSDTVISVSWDETTNECPIQGYRVTWTGTSLWNGEKINGYRDTDKTTMELDNLMPYFDYEIYVSEITTDGIVGDPSDPATATTEQGAASAPVPVTSLALGPYSAQINWSLPETPNGVIIGYHVSCQILPDSTDECDLLTDEDTFTVTATKLKACGDYTFSVQAINSYGYGEPGTYSSRTDSEPPPHFTNFGFKNKTSTSAVLTWDPLDTNCPVLIYNIIAEETVFWNDNTDTIRKSYSGEDNFYLLEDLTPYSLYEISIRATTEGGTTNIEHSDTQEIVTLEGVAGPPEYLNSSTIDFSTVLLNWGASTAINGMLHGYHICYKKTEEVPNDCHITTTDYTYSYEVSDLDACTDYTFTVQAINGVGDGETATTQSKTDNEPPGNFTSFSAEKITSTSALLTWELLETNCSVTNYTLHVEETVLWSDYTNSFNRNFITEEDYYLLEDLTPYSYYDISLTATSGGGSNTPIWQEIETLEDDAEAPAFLYSSPVDFSTVLLNWGPSTAINGELQGYHICYRKKGELENDCHITTDENTLSYQVQGLDACTNYTFAVQAINRVGDGDEATTQSKTDSDTPQNFTSFGAEKITSTSALLTWELLETNCPVTNYTLHVEETVLWSDSTDSININFLIEDNHYLLEDLTPYSYYDISLTATSEGGSNTPIWLEIETLEDAAEPPEFVSSSTVDFSTILVNWGPSTAINGELQGYHICYRKKGEITNDCHITTDENTLSYLVQSLDACTDYTFAVQAINRAGDGNEDTTQSKTYSESPPDITNFQAINMTSTTAILTWDPLLTGCTVLNYNVQVQGLVVWSNETDNFETSFVGEENTYLLEDLIPSATYSIYLTAETDGGDSNPAFTEFQTLDDALGAPVIEEFTSPSPCSLLVIWECDETCSDDLSGYKVRWQQTGSQETSEVTEGYHTNFYEIQELISDTSYTVWVSSVKSSGQPHTGPALESYTKIGEPVEVTGVTIGDVSDTVINVSWDETTNDCPIQGYRVTFTGTYLLNGEVTKGYRDTDKTTVELDNLEPYTDYEISVSEITTDGIVGDPSDPATATTEQGAASPPEPVTSLTLGPHRAQVNWSLPEAPNGDIIGYHVSCQILPDYTDDCDLLADEATFTATATELKACGDYTFSVQALTSEYGEPGTHSSRTDPEQPPDFTNFSYDNLTSTSVVLTWDPLDTNCPVLHYVLQGQGTVLWSDDTDEINLMFNTEDNYYLLTDLIPYTQYDLSLHATTEGGNTRSISQEIVTLEAVAEPPAYVNSSTVDKSSILLSWTPSTALNGELQHYHILCKKKGELGHVYDERTTELTYTASGLEACGDYTFTVTAVNGAGDGNEATSESRTEPEPPPPVTNLVVVAENSTNITITFEAPETTCDILRYDVLGFGEEKWENWTVGYGFMDYGGKETYVLGNMIPFTSYKLNMTATTEGGISDLVMFEAETLKDVPEEPWNFVAQELDPYRVLLTWQEPSSQNGRTLMDYYLTYESLGPESDYIVVNRSLNRYILGNTFGERIMPCQAYVIRLRASNEVGIGPPATATARMDPDVPYAVNELRCSSTGSEYIEITWKVDHSTCIIQYYEISLSGDILWDGTTADSRNVSTNDGSLTITGLIPNTNYNITLTPATEAGLGEPTTCNCETDPDVPSAPSKLTLLDITESSFSVVWEDPELENGIMKQFRVYLYHGVEILVETIVPYSDDDSIYTYSFKQLESKTPYEVSVAAENDVGIGATADLLVITL